MSETRERCAVCDFPLATDADWDGEDNGALCWSAATAAVHRGPRIDWRARALEVAREHADAMKSTLARVEALEGALREWARVVSGFRLGIDSSRSADEADTVLLTFARNTLPGAPTKPAPRPDATEALRVAMEALGKLIEQCHALSHAVQPAVGVARLRLGSPFTEDFGDKACAALDAWAPAVRGGAAALELLRAHVESTPLETAVQAHTEKEA